MTWKSHKLFITLLGILVLSLCGYSLFTSGKKVFAIDGVNEHHPFTVDYSVYGTMIYVDKQFSKLHIKEMSYECEGNTRIFLKDQHYSYDYLDGVYIEEHSKQVLGYFNQINPKKWFKYKKIGDMFKFTLKIRYSFDNEPENTQISEFEVNIYKEEHVSFLGWSLMEWIILFFFGATI